ncbi:MAG: lyase family protein [Specibacter sp.]
MGHTAVDGILGDEAADYGLLSPAWAGTQVAVRTGDRAFLQALLDIECAWVQVQADHGYADPAAVAPVQAAANAGLYDIAGIAARAQGGGNPLIPLLADLRARVSASDPAAASPIHSGATSQDVMDSALMLMSARTLEVIEADLRTAARALALLARDHRDTLCVARTLTQHSLPTTFGLKAAQWLHGLGQAGNRLARISGSLPLQWGGAAGTMAALTWLTNDTDDDGPLALVAALADKLGLADPVAPWHSNRLPMTSLGQSLADVVAAAGKIANDVLLLCRPEFGELSEPVTEGRGISSAMPQKQNPVLSILIRSAALAAPGYQLQLQAAAGAAIDERPDGSWHAEWQALRQLLRLTGGAAAKLAELCEGLAVHPQRMRANVDLTGPLLVSEKVTTAVAPLLDGAGTGTGKRKVQALVDQSLANGVAGPGLRALLRQAVPHTMLSHEALDRLLDPAQYLGQNSALIDRIIARYAEWSSA